MVINTTATRQEASAVVITITSKVANIYLSDGRNMHTNVANALDGYIATD
jgi:hypothetical protein